MFTRTTIERSGVCPRRGLIERIAEAIYEASLRRTLKAIKAH